MLSPDAAAIDAAMPSDAGIDGDGGNSADSGPVSDGGERRDAGPTTDADPMMDAAIGVDAGSDAGSDVSPDAGPGDAGPGDAGSDGGPDAGVDGGAPAPAATEARFPPNGWMSLSPHVASDAPVADHPLRPSLTWEDVPGAERYQIQMTRECALDGFRSCAFMSAELDEMSPSTTFVPATSLPVAAVAPVGSRYYWRVRACADGGGCSAWTEVRYLDVGRDPHDFNGDGYADLATGADGQDSPESDEGSVYVFNGSATGVSIVPDVFIDNPLSEPGGAFGASIASAGDVNGDGYSDLLVGAPGQVSTSHVGGSAYVFFGGPGGLSPVPDLSFDNPLDQAGGEFGASVAAGDVDGDGYADLLIGAPLQDSALVDPGVAYLYLGGLGALAGVPDLSIDNPRRPTSGHFGQSVACAGDTNGDGYVDLLIGATGAGGPDRVGGWAHLYFGGQSGPSIVPDISLSNPLDQPEGAFGAAVAGAGDLNDDGYADVIVGAPGQESPGVDAGSAYVFLGGSIGPSDMPDFSLDNPLGQRGGLFGFSVACAGDVNADGYADLIVGAASQDSPAIDAGSAYLYFGRLSGPASTPDLALHNPWNQVGGAFGFSVSSAGDVNGDGYAELVIGAPNQSVPEADEGNVYLYFGGVMGPGTLPELWLDNPTDQLFGGFGRSLALLESSTALVVQCG